jgi:hypothetical protein
MRVQWLVVVSCVVGASCAPSPGRHVEREVPLVELHELAVQGPVSVTLITGGSLAPRLRFEGPEGDVDRVRWWHRGGTLHLEAAPSASESPVHVELVVPSLRAVLADEGARVTARHLLGGRVRLEARRGAHLLIGRLDADTARLEASADGVVDVAGRARVLEAHADDVGAIAAKGLETHVARVDANGLSTVGLGPTTVLRANVRRASRLSLSAPASQQRLLVDESSTLETSAPAPGPASATALPR